MKSYLINLDAAKDRLGFMRAQFDLLGVEFERIPAVTPATAASNSRHGRIEAPAPRILSDGEVACLLSHYDAFQRLAESGEACAAIFEDDVHLAKGTRSLVELTDLPLRGPWILKLETLNKTKLFKPRVLKDIPGIAISKLADNHWGTAAYIISRAAALLLLKSPIPSRPADGIFFEVRFPPVPLVHYQVLPALAIQDVFREVQVGLAAAITDRTEVGAAQYPQSLWQRIRWTFQRRVVLPLFTRRRAVVPFAEPQIALPAALGVADVAKGQNHRTVASRHT